MAIKFQEHTLDSVKIFNTQAVKDILQPYEDKDIDAFYEQLKKIKEVEFIDESMELRDCTNVELFKRIEDVDLTQITEKYHDLRERINKAMSIKNRFNDYKKNWIRVQYVLESMYERNKDVHMISPAMRDYKNKDEKLSATNVKLDMLIRAMTFVELVMINLKQFETEIKETMEYLMDVKQDVSRIQSGVSLALDTGEIPRTFWKDNKYTG